MLNKSQIKIRIEWILQHRQVADKRWFVEQLESLVSSMYSPEKFEKLKESSKPRNVYPCGDR